MTEREAIWSKLGKDRKAYIKAYAVEDGTDNVIDLHIFNEVFGSYIQQRPITKDGVRLISPQSFRDYVQLRSRLSRATIV